MGKIVYCPTCHQRLFDIGQPSQGQIKIKCPRCRQIQHINLYGLERSHEDGSKHMAT